MELFVAEQRRLWGDYGDVLISGFASREGDDGPLLLHRTGPFLPPIFFPWEAGHRVAVSDDFRNVLESIGLAGIEFRAAIKHRIVRHNWHTWNLRAKAPRKYPPEGEPGNYIWDQSHDPGAAAEMPEAWELLPPVVPLRIEQMQDEDGMFLDEFRAFPAQEDYPRIFTDRRSWATLIVTSEFRPWLEEHVGEWVVFRPVKLMNKPGSRRRPRRD
jgi:hypothetical protein